MERKDTSLTVRYPLTLQTAGCPLSSGLHHLNACKHHLSQHAKGRITLAKQGEDDILSTAHSTELRFMPSFLFLCSMGGCWMASGLRGREGRTVGVVDMPSKHWCHALCASDSAGWMSLVSLSVCV